MEPLSDGMVQQYLEHLGVSRTIEPNLDNLNALIRAHLERVAFENLNFVLGANISLDAEVVLTNVTRRGRGGSCFELNCLFGRLLQALGYRVQLRAARLRLSMPDDSSAKVPLTHIALLVRLIDGDPYLVDVGKAVVGIERALPLRGGDTKPFRVRNVDGSGTLELSVPTESGGWKVFFTMEPYDLEWVDVIPLAWYSSSHPDSGMKRVLLARRRSEGGGCWLQLSRNRFIRWSPTDGILEKRIMQSEDEIVELLQRVFRLRLSTEDDIEPLRVRLRELLPAWRLHQSGEGKKGWWPER